MYGHSYAEQIKRTKCGAIDDYHYYRIGRRIRSEAFHAFMKRLWVKLSGGAREPQTTIATGLRWEPAPSHPA